MFLLLEEKKSYYAQYSSQVKEKRYVLLLHTLGGVQEPLFLAKDVAEWIEHSNVSMMLNKVDNEEKQMIQIGTLNNAYSAWFLTEDGLYEVLMQSRKPIAKQIFGGIKNEQFSNTKYKQQIICR